MPIYLQEYIVYVYEHASYMIHCESFVSLATGHERSG